MNALSCGRCSSLILSAPGASQSMSASAHWPSLTLARIASMSIAIGSSCGWDSSERGGPRHQADGAGVGTRDQAFDVPADLGFELRHAVQVAAIVGVQAGLRHFVRRDSGPAHDFVGELIRLRGDAAGFEDVGLDEGRAQNGDFYSTAG